MNWETILALGDSITIGARTYLGYPEQAGHQLSKSTNKFWNVVNFAKSGITAIELSRMLAQSFDNLCAHKPDLISVLIGTNDVKQNTALGHFEVAMEQVLVKARLIGPGAQLLLWEIPQLGIGVKYPYQIAMNHEILQYNLCLKQLSKKYKCQLERFDFHADDYCDGVHLNEKGIEQAACLLAQKILTQRGLAGIKSSNGLA